MRSFLSGIMILFALTSQRVHGADSVRKPNIVLIVADDMGYTDAGCYGAKDIRTPNLDRLAKEGTRFTNFCVAQPVCTASRAAIMTGCYPNRIGLSGALNHTSLIGIHSDETLLPELLRAQGYTTAHFGKWHLGTRPPFFPTRNGFDEWIGLPYSNDNGPLHPTVRGIPALPLYDNEAGPVAVRPDKRPGRITQCRSRSPGHREAVECSGRRLPSRPGRPADKYQGQRIAPRRP